MLKIKQDLQFNLSPGLCFFDIETTGLSAQTSYVYLIGFIRMEDSKCVMTQLFCEDFNEEKELLKTFFSLVPESDTLVHYNGSTFDIPYLNKKSHRHALMHEIDAAKTVDIYKILCHYKKYFEVENLKLKTVESCSGFIRSDKFEGAELIDLYSELTGMIRLANLSQKSEYIDKVNALENVILLHNSDDLLGLLYIYLKTNIQNAIGNNLSCSTDINDFEITVLYNSPIFPVKFEFGENGIYLNNGSERAELVINITKCELIYFLEDYKNYTYIIDQDMCMHNSIVSGIAKENKKKCTKDTAFIRKSSRFVPLPDTMCDYVDEHHIKIFKYERNSKEKYIELIEDTEFLKIYAGYVLGEI